VIVAALPLLLLPGCARRLSQVEGKVTLEDGNPLTKGLVVFESAEGKGVTARGEIKADEQKDLPFDIKYLKFETSGLECEVKAGPNDFPIRLSKPQKKEEKEEKKDVGEEKEKQEKKG